ncbi:MAG: LysR family transcriptional regulator [Eggerthellaceae bacterium]|nr:LysR family transcriptional regulator [Eggerthellaceae bacterium]
MAIALNYSKVAKKFHLSPSVLSKHIAALERELGQRLFDRSPSSVELTAAGRFFYEGIAPVISDYQQFMDDFHLKMDRGHQDLKICIGIRAEPILRAVAIAAGNMRRDGNAKIAFDSISRGPLYSESALTSPDATIVYTSGRVPSRAIVVPIGKDPFMAVVPIEHPLAQNESVSLARDLSQHPIILLRDSYFEPGQDSIREAFESCNIAPNYVYSLATSFDDITFFFNFKDVLIMPAQAVPLLRAVTPQTHKVLPFEEDLYFQQAVVYLPEKESPRLLDFIEQVKQAYAQGDSQA